MKRSSLLLFLVLLAGCVNPTINPVVDPEPNQPPEVWWGAMHYGDADLYEWEFSFTAVDEDGMIVRAVWRINDETIELEHYLDGGLWAWPELTYTFPQAGCYDLQVTVWDDDGAKAVSRADPCFEVRTPGTF